MMHGSRAPWCFDFAAPIIYPSPFAGPDSCTNVLIEKRSYQVWVNGCEEHLFLTSGAVPWPHRVAEWCWRSAIPRAAPVRGQLRAGAIKGHPWGRLLMFLTFLEVTPGESPKARRNGGLSDVQEVRSARHSQSGGAGSQVVRAPINRTVRTSKVPAPPWPSACAGHEVRSIGQAASPATR